MRQTRYQQNPGLSRSLSRRKDRRQRSKICFAQHPGLYRFRTGLKVGFAPGTGPDVVTRLLGQKLSELMKQPFVIDNRAGAGGQIAAQFVAKIAPDGYNLLIADVSAISIAPAAFTKLAYDPLRELVPVSEVVRTDFILVVPGNSPAKTYAEFVKSAVANKDKVNFGTFGAGTPGHFGAEMLAEQGHFKIEPVHFRATGDAVTALIAGDVHAALMSTALASAQIKGGKMRALATTAPTRSSMLPDVPTFKESGYPERRLFRMVLPVRPGRHA